MRTVRPSNFFIIYRFVTKLPPPPLLFRGKNAYHHSILSSETGCERRYDGRKEGKSAMIKFRLITYDRLILKY